MHENEAYFSVRSFPRHRALEIFNAATANGQVGDGVYNWPSGVNFLLRSYVTEDDIDRGIAEL